LSYILRYVSFTEVGNVCRVVFREPMYLCIFVSEEGDDGEVSYSGAQSLLSYTLRYVSFVEVGSVCRVVLREPMYLCTCVVLVIVVYYKSKARDKEIISKWVSV
jgi:hypothetical protein